MGQPNIVIVMTDQQRWDTLGVYGNRHIRTPNLDRLATEGVLFEKAFVPIPLCTPSRASLFTGQYPSRHGLRANEVFPLPVSAPNMLNTFREAGYTTLMAGKDHVFGQEGLSRLFDRVVEYNHFGRGKGMYGIDEDMDEAERSVFDFRKSLMGVKYVDLDPHDILDTPTVRITDAAIEMVQDAKDLPFFLWLSYPDPHPPFVVAEPYASMYRGRPVGHPATREGEMDDKPLRQKLGQHFLRSSDRYSKGRNIYCEEDIQRIREIYYGMVSLIDDQVGRFAQALEGLALSEDTILVFMSDHGEFLGSHSMVRKTTAMYDDLVRIPLFVRWPGHIKPARITESVAESVDLAPTLLDLAGLPLLDQVEGKSMSPLLLGQSSKHKDYAFGIYGVEGEPTTEEDIKKINFDEDVVYIWGNNVGPLVMRGRFAMVRGLEWKLVYYKGGEGELYNLAEDPNELYNRYDDPACATIQATLMRKLLEWALDTIPTWPEYVIGPCVKPGQMDVSEYRKNRHA
jgi:arylsulfatase